MNKKLKLALTITAAVGIAVLDLHNQQVKRQRVKQRSNKEVREFLQRIADNMIHSYGEQHAELGRCHTKQGKYADMTHEEWITAEAAIQHQIEKMRPVFKQIDDEIVQYS